MTRTRRALRVLLAGLLCLGDLGGSISPAAAANPFYTATGNPTANSAGSSAVMRTEFALIQAGFDLVPQITTTGAYHLTIALGADVTLAAPVLSGTLATLAGAESLSNKIIVSPALTGIPTTPTAAPLTDNTQVASTAYADLAVAVEATRAAIAEALLAPKASPAFTGTPTAPTASALTATTQLATTAFDTAAVGVETTRATAAEGTNATAITTETSRAEAAEALLAPKASPTFTGVPLAPTATVGTSTTQLATTAFVAAARVNTLGNPGKIVMGTITIQWGSNAVSNGDTITFATAFSGTPTAIFVQPETGAGATVMSSVNIPSSTGFSLFTNTPGGTPEGCTVYWIAIGPT